MKKTVIKKTTNSNVISANDKIKEIKQEIKIQKIKQDVNINSSDSIQNIVDAFVLSCSEIKKYAAKNDLGGKTKSYANVLVDVASEFLKTFTKESMHPTKKSSKK